jgi:glycolate oxidase iron-sulfur subunit
LPRPGIFGPAVKLGQVLRPLLPSALADRLPALSQSEAKPWPAKAMHERRMLATGRLRAARAGPEYQCGHRPCFDKLGIALFEEAKAGCCGAVRFHLNDQSAARDDMRRNIDAWWPHIEAGVEAIVVTASGCGVQVRDYGHALADDAVYAEKAAKVSELCRDPAEIIAAERQRMLDMPGQSRLERGKLAFHSPCTLQHGLKIRGIIEDFLNSAGYIISAFGRRPSVLRLRRNIFCFAARIVGAIARQQAGSPERRRTTHDRDSQYWLPDASAGRQCVAGQALD